MDDNCITSTGGLQLTTITGHTCVTSHASTTSVNRIARSSVLTLTLLCAILTKCIGSAC